MRKNLFNIFLCTTLLALVAFFTDTIRTDATTTPSQTTSMKEASDGLSSAPDNLGLGDGLFVPGDFSGYNGAKNFAMLESKGNRPEGTTSDPMAAIRMTTYINQQGAMWSNVDKGNYVDISKNQTLSLWMYFGPQTHTNSGDGFGDGMALVLQNSADGIKAFSHDGTTISNGETMGVWGIDKGNTTATVDASTAIPNSLAVEFDTDSNNSKTQGNGFDEGISGQHIAWGYPGDPSTYTPSQYRPFLSLGTNYYAKMNHQGTQSADLHDGYWHHVTVHWDPAADALTYYFNDKSVDGTPQTGTKTTIPNVSANEFGGKANEPTHLRWGVVATTQHIPMQTTGGNYEANLVAFESIPSSVEGEVNTDIDDLTQNKTIKDSSTDTNVNSGDNLAFNYNLQYDSGLNEWSNDVATIKLPSNITYTPDANGAIGYVTYPDDGDAATEPITTAEYKDGIVTHTLKQALSSTKPTKAKITINGTANDVSTNTKVAAAHANFKSTNLILDANTPEFTIKKAKPISLSLDQSNITVDAGKSTKITGSVFYADGTRVTNSNVNVHATLNGTALDTFALSDSTNLNNAVSGELSFNIAADKLTQPTNTLKVYVEDTDGNVSTTSTVIITKKGGLKLTVDPDYSFGNLNQTTATKLITRKKKWNIVVDDSREDSTTSPWNLEVGTNGLYNGTNKFNGNVIFKNTAGTETSLSDSLFSIAQGYKKQIGDQMTDVSGAWNDSDGLMLKSNGESIAGKYTATLDWTLADTPQ